MDVVSVLSYGIDNTGKTCIADKLTALIESLPDDTELLFPAGTYYFTRVIPVIGKKNLTVRGENATLVTHYSPWDDPAKNNNGFDIKDCENLTFRNFTFTTDEPVSCAGEIIAVNPETRSYDVKIYDEFPVTGWEHFYGANTCDAEGTPDYVIATYDRITSEVIVDETGQKRTKITGVVYSLVGDNVIRVKAPETVIHCYGDKPKEFDMTSLYIGQRIYFRYTIYGNSLFIFSGCKTVTLSHIEIERCASMGAVIYPRCSDFTFEAFNIRPPKGSHAICPANADGIHVIGLTGYLYLKDCHFDGLGDDALNVHSQAGEIASIDHDAGTIFCIYRDRQMNACQLSPLWAEAGDTVAVYDRETFIKKGKFRIDSYKNGMAHISDVSGTYAVGDILANEAFFPSVHIQDCTCMHTRARGFLLQSKNMTIERCHIRGTSLPAIIISPDVRVWYEVGPSENVVIRDCLFEKNSLIMNGACLGAVVVKACHDIGPESYPAGVHKNIRMENNIIRDSGAGGIYITATDGVTLTGNRFENCAGKPIVLNNCINVTEENNICVK